MDYLVNMVRNSNEAGGRDRFSCSDGTWSLLLELATSFGWKSLGTRYVPGEFSSAPDNPTRHDYQPGDQRDSKLVTATDAIQLATALSEARSSPHLTAMMGERGDVLSVTPDSVPFHTTLDEFIAYAFGGELSFSRSR